MTNDIEHFVCFTVCLVFYVLFKLLSQEYEEVSNMELGTFRG